MSIFRSSRRSARAQARSELDRRRAAPGVTRAGDCTSPRPIDIEGPDPRQRTEANRYVVDSPEDGSFDVAIVATKGRWLDRRSLVVEVELTLPTALTLDQAVAMTETVEAAVLVAIPETRASGADLTGRS